MEQRGNPVSVIAIDGPVASGKTVIGRKLARKMNFQYLDTGIMYRAVTWLSLQQGVESGDQARLETLAQENPVDIYNSAEEWVKIGGHRVGEDLRSSAVTARVSLVSRVSGVRRAMVQQQRDFASQGKVVMVGRDIGTVVLPDADFKVFLTASVQERAARRWRELAADNPGLPLEQVVRETAERDRVDSERSDSPLKPAADAWTLDTSDLGISEVVELIAARAGGTGKAAPA